MNELLTEPIDFDYESQALNFLTRTKSTLTFKFLRYGKHFDDDKENRFVFTFTLTRGSRSYTGQFGQSVAETYKVLTGKDIFNRKRTTYEEERFSALAKSIKDDGTFSPRFLSASFGEKCIGKAQIPAPKAYDLLACLSKDCPGTFKDFCSEFGYCDDSMRAHKTYEAVQNEWLNLQGLYNESEMSELREIN